jgi:MoaA/NifB/PqqE/SkfB family radical SAM enzyme
MLSALEGVIAVVKWREKADLLRGLITHEISHTPPFFVSVDLTRRCNLSCLHCRYHSCLSEFPSPVDDPRSDMNPVVLDKLLCELEGMGTKEIIFAGEGEPILYPQFFDAVSKAKAAGMHVNVITNGTLLTEKVINKLIELKLDLLTVSLWASSKEEYEKLYPGTKPEFFFKVLEALKRVSDLKAVSGSFLPRLRLHRPISRDNFMTVETGLEQAYAGGCDQFTVAPIHSLKGDMASHKLSAEEQEMVLSSLFRAKKSLRQRSMHNNIDDALRLYRIGDAVWDTLPCYVGWVHTRIRIDGTVYPCGRCDTPLGSLNEKSLSRIWNGEPYRRFRKTVSTRKGLAGMQSQCVCGYCCHIRNSLKVHRIFRWIDPLIPGAFRRRAFRGHNA